MTLTPTQRELLAAAAARHDRSLHPLPDRLKGGGAKKSLDGLVARGFAENEPEGTLVATEAGLAALARDGGDAGADEPREEERQQPRMARNSPRGDEAGRADRAPARGWRRHDRRDDRRHRLGAPHRARRDLRRAEEAARTGGPQREGRRPRPGLPPRRLTLRGPACGPASAPIARTDVAARSPAPATPPRTPRRWRGSRQRSDAGRRGGTPPPASPPPARSRRRGSCRLRRTRGRGTGS